MIAVREEVREVLEQVREWPPEDRRQLAEEILRSLRPAPPGPVKKKSLEDLWGSVRMEGPPPDDAAVRRMVDERRMQKFGG